MESNEIIIASIISLVFGFIPFPPFMEQLIWTISLTMWGIAAAICLSTFNEIASLNDLDKTKEKLNNKKEKLESKL